MGQEQKQRGFADGVANVIGAMLAIIIIPVQALWGAFSGLFSEQQDGQQKEQQDGQQKEQQDGQQKEQQDGQQKEQQDGQQREQQDGQHGPSASPTNTSNGAQVEKERIDSSRS